jgi:hypothetical protein
MERLLQHTHRRWIMAKYNESPTTVEQEVDAVEEKVVLEKVMSVYSGIDGKCCCGCSGKHTYASAHVRTGSRHRGYPVKDDEVNDRVVKRVVNKINRLIDAGEPVSIDEDFVSAVVGRRVYIAYFVPSEV